MLRGWGTQGKGALGFLEAVGLARVSNVSWVRTQPLALPAARRGSSENRMKLSDPGFAGGGESGQGWGGGESRCHGRPLS